MLGKFGDSKIDHGAYIGYTHGDKAGLPTLYFANGHFTQTHDPDNVGWHPNAAYHHLANIDNAQWDRYNTMRKKNDTVGKNKFKLDFVAGKFRSDAEDAALFECSSSDNKTWYGHPSRSRLMQPGDKGFDEKYNSAYALKQVATAKLAKNEL